MWTQMVLNFHILDFYITWFSHITHATPKMPFPHQIWNFLHLPFNEQFEVSHGRTTCQPTALLWQGTSFPILKFLCIFYSYIHYYLQRKQERNRKRQSSAMFSLYYFSLTAFGYDCSYFCFMHVTQLNIS